MELLRIRTITAREPCWKYQEGWRFRSSQSVPGMSGSTRILFGGLAKSGECQIWSTLPGWYWANSALTRNLRKRSLNRIATLITSGLAIRIYQMIFRSQSSMLKARRMSSLVLGKPLLRRKSCFKIMSIYWSRRGRRWRSLRLLGARCNKSTVWSVGLETLQAQHAVRKLLTEDELPREIAKETSASSRNK